MSTASALLPVIPSRQGLWIVSTLVAVPTGPAAENHRRIGGVLVEMGRAESERYILT
jgi:hypothetical protein